MGAVVPSELAPIVAPVMGEEAAEVVMTGAERLRQEGRVEGRVEGRRELLLRLLEAKFGTIPQTIRERVGAGTSDEVDRWATRVLDAPGVSDVLDAE